MTKAKKENKYATQNAKIWTINFSNSRNVKRAKVVVPSLMKKTDLQSRGITILVAIEYCLQERVMKDFLAYANSRRRSLI